MKNYLKIIGMTATVVGFIATLVSDWVDQQATEELVEDKVNEILAQRDKQ